MIVDHATVTFAIAKLPFPAKKALPRNEEVPNDEDII
ncbi:hypothetical protein FHS68_000488 [Dyadobacter arcticus]|uniref:Uncharacterized protein n=1 Tax=Dyadobacter arcticus TaxID=1078754 RepID=A0ABX0UEC3_9BACT|nr:hypothetical protein [Dyadobacter arcticus]